MKNPAQTRRQGGFTLIEMAIVLVIIGLIIAGVSVGKDAMRNAERQKIAKSFVMAWADAYNAYYARAGVVLGDTKANPSGYVGGAAGNTVVGGAAGTAGTLQNLMNTVGIRYPEGQGTTHEHTYNYLDNQGVTQTATISFTSFKAGTTTSGLVGNVMVISGLTPELAQAIDAIIDGRNDGTAGVFRSSDATAWADSTIESRSGAATTAETTYIAHWKMQQ